MLQQFRRVVTGHDEKGRSVFVADEVVPLPPTMPEWPSRGATTIWVSDRGPASNVDSDLPPFSESLPGFAPMGSGGVSFMVMQIPPEIELDDMTPEQRAVATTPVARLFPGGEAMEIDSSKHYGMHATDTLDILVMLQGELVLMLDEGEVTLKPFDTVIQRGTHHGWVNRGTEPALIASAVIDAAKLERNRENA